MAARHVFAFTLSFALSSSALLFTLDNTAFAQAEQAVPAVPNARFEFMGRAMANNVPVQSGPGKGGFYATQHLKKDQKVHIVGIKGDWLKIVPPEGSFSYVPSAYVTRRADGKIGRVNTEANVRTGSSVNGMKSTIQTKLEPGTDVKILDEHEEYYKIEPPEGAYLFVEKKYVEAIGPVQEEKTETVAVKPAEPQPDNAAPQDQQPGDVADVKPEQEAITQTPDPKQPTDAPKPDAVATTQQAKPDAVASLEDFRKVEADYASASKQPVIEQPIKELAQRYEKLSNSGTLTGTTKRIVEARLKALQMRADARAQLEAFRKSQDELKDRQRALLAENEEIKARVNETQVSLYAAVGTLRVSSLQQGNQTLYRLTDPTTGRTLVYVRSNDPEYAGMLNKFVGVKGDLSTDERLKMKIITPTSAEPVDQSKVNQTIIATISPPGLLIASPQSASVDTSETGN